MNHIITHLWFDKEAKRAAEYYVGTFPDSKILSFSQIEDTPSGTCDILSISLAGCPLNLISAGPYFKFNPSISLFVEYNNLSEIDAAWKRLSDKGRILMEYQEYPWANKYGWVEDQFGLSWQLSFSIRQEIKQKITPFLMFTGDMAGKAHEAIKEYVKIFPDSNIDTLNTYEKGDGDKEGYLKHSRFSLFGSQFMAIDSSHPHEFGFNESISFIVNCENQKEIDYYWEKLSSVPESEQCGWLKDKFNVSWQIIPTKLGELMGSGDKEATNRVMQSFLKMKKLNITELENAFREVKN